MTTTASTTTVLDVPTLVSQLMAIERQPITTLQNEITTDQSKISSFGTIKSLVSTLQSDLSTASASFSGYTTTSSDSSVMSASVGTSAVAGNYTLAVTSLASAQTLATAGQASSTSAITSSESTLGFTINGTTTSVTIAAGASLGDIRDAINNANLGVSATIVNNGSGTNPYQLVLTSSSTGTANAVSGITVQGDSALGSLLSYGGSGSSVTQQVAAADAKFTVNGIAITSASNTVTDAIQGVTLTLKNTTASSTLTVSRDTSGMETALSSFVDAYNALVSQLKSRSAYSTSSSDTSQILAGDGTLRSMLDQLRGILTTPATGGTLSFMSEAGISVQADGSLKFDSSKFESAVANNFSDVQNLFTNSSSGFLTRFSQFTTSALQTGGLIDTKVSSLNSTIDSYNDQIDKLNERMTILQKQYTTTYTNLNTYLASMDSLSTYLTSELAIINNSKSS